MVAFDHTAHHFPPQGLSFLSKKELATACARSLERMAFAGLPHGFGVRIPDLIFIYHYHRRFAATPFKNTGRAIQQCTFPLADHRYFRL
ncbi:hypothetical protein EOK75_01025 [Pseudorhodobacter turbinis]|uniref:Uncharacterized protein n=1 Tax=Pseudorhodobacter turbinis TaxID=2500533 RepID=A0A4P8ECT3_9RHOB|nr:hypothetical protein [Pseudorhodobacter turbinis]QCO54529.1 hypothetical protein EOK75_01025 [Pseudorhodobacter turbinis]